MRLQEESDNRYYRENLFIASNWALKIFLVYRISSCLV
jgi:hypothetical protein